MSNVNEQSLAGPCAGAASPSDIARNDGPTAKDAIRERDRESLNLAAFHGPGSPTPQTVRMDWGLLVPHLIHPTKVFIIEAMLWINRPLSATEFEKMAKSTIAISNFSYHLDHLARCEALEVITKLKARKVQGTKQETFYYFRGENGWATKVTRAGDLLDPLLSTALGIAAAIVSIGGPAAGFM